MVQHAFLGMIHRLDRHDYHMGQVVELSQIFRGIVPWLIHAAGIEKGQEWRISSWELILPRIARARLETMPDLRVVRSR